MDQLRSLLNRRLLSMAVALAACLLVVGSAIGADPPSDDGAGVPGGPLTERAVDELRALPPDAQIVACSPDLAKYPAFTRPSRLAGYQQLRPGRYLLIDGHCAYSPSAKGEPLREDSADGP